MSEAKMGAYVLYCGHAGGFIADIWRIENVNVVRANGPVTTDNLIRKDFVPTHHLEDWPKAGFWRPDLGVFVVPCSQVHDLAFKEEKRPTKCHHIWTQEKPSEIDVTRNIKVLYHRCINCGKLKTTRRMANSKAPK